ncbi:MAG: trypsin-like peptidase domain-containing protein [Chloroflexi bacterium]|nr:trypsin-like peptidase domain-containing protein [Chloroflexota bacterium]
MTSSSAITGSQPCGSHGGAFRLDRPSLRALAFIVGVLVIASSACVSSDAHEELRSQLNKTQRQLAAQQTEVTRLTAEVSREQGRSGEVVSQRDGLLAELSAAQGRNTDLEKQLASLQTSFELYRKDVSDLASNLSEARQTNGALNGQIDSLKAELSQANGSNGTLNRQVLDLRSQLTLLQSSNSRESPRLLTTAEVFAQASRCVVRIRNSRGSGSGFFFDSEGHILTNAHVVGADGKVTVVVGDSRSFVGDVVARDEVRDVAVVKLNIQHDASLAFGDSDKAAVGDEVLAIGYALGSTLAGQASLSKGVVSAKRRDKSVDVIQIDAPLNPGNSGGPLLNTQGEVIGMNRAVIRGKTGTPIESIGFAISINSIKDLLPSLLAAP